jgi:hypothetical protein
MKRLSIFTAAAILVGASSVAACPWAGGTYKGDDQQFRTQFTVNAGCTEMVFQSSGSAGFQKADTPETVALSPTDAGWEATISGVKSTLLSNGKQVEFIGPGVNKRLRVYK